MACISTNVGKFNIPVLQITVSYDGLDISNRLPANTYVGMKPLDMATCIGQDWISINVNDADPIITKGRDHTL